MRIKNIFILLSLTLALSAFGQKKAAYTIYDKNGKKVSYKKMLKNTSKNDVVLFGEFHNNPISHWLQLELAKDMHAKDSNLVLGAEMFERDNQGALDLYLQDSIDYKGLDTLARLWPNYKTDYAPLVDFAKTNNLSFIGTNIPRRYASLVYKHGGFDTLTNLPQEEKNWIAPLPIQYDPTLPQYEKILAMMGGHGSPDLVKAQAIKDATMAHFILSNYQPGYTFLHFNGCFHSDFHEGIYWYLKQTNDTLNVLTISTVEQDDISKLDKEHLGRADYIICVDADMTKTY
jgi:uncharacterized iron-regulated protein